MSRFIALHCGEETTALLSGHPKAFLLLTQIAIRSKWKDCPISKMKAGQAFVGDWREAGLGSEMAYRHAKAVLAECGIATFKGTNKGTVATLTDSTIFSLSTPASNGPRNDLETDEERPSNGRGTSNNTDIRKTQSTQIEESQIDFQSIVGAYPRRENVQEALGYVSESVKRGADPAAILTGTRAIAAVIGQLPSAHLNAFVVSAKTFFKNERWRDDPQTWLRHGASKNGAAASSLDLGGRSMGTMTRIVNGTVETKKL